MCLTLLILASFEGLLPPIGRSDPPDGAAQPRPCGGESGVTGLAYAVTILSLPDGLH